MSVVLFWYGFGNPRDRSTQRDRSFVKDRLLAAIYQQTDWTLKSIVR